MAKYNARIESVRINMVRRKHATSTACPHYCMSLEDTDHIVTCPSIAASTLYNTQMIKLEYFLKQTPSRELQQAILEIVGGLRHQRDAIYDEGWT
jgi:hypothetical protein